MNYSSETSYFSQKFSTKNFLFSKIKKFEKRGNDSFWINANLSPKFKMQAISLHRVLILYLCLDVKLEIL